MKPGAQAKPASLSCAMCSRWPATGTVGSNAERVHWRAERGCPALARNTLRDRAGWSKDGCDQRWQEDLVPEVGDQIEWVATKVDQGSRRGVVTGGRGRLLAVR